MHAPGPHCHDGPYQNMYASYGPGVRVYVRACERACVGAWVHARAYATQYKIYTIVSTNVRQRTLKSLAIMSSLITMFVHKRAERRVSWRQTVRAEVIAASVGVQVQRYPMFAQCVAVVRVAHERRRHSFYRRRQSVFGYDTAKDRSGARVHRH